MTLQVGFRVHRIEFWLYGIGSAWGVRVVEPNQVREYSSVIDI